MMNVLNNEVLYFFFQWFLPSSLFLDEFRGFLWFKRFQWEELKMAALQDDAVQHLDDQNNVQIQFIDEEDSRKTKENNQDLII